jgi:exoribonuclease-2
LQIPFLPVEQARASVRGLELPMSEGKITEYIDQKKVILSVCLKDRGSKLQLLTQSNHEVSISPKRALFISSTALDISRSREEMLMELKEIEKRRAGYMKQVSVHDLWELTYEEDEVFTYQYLAQLVFGKSVTDDHISALVRALFADKIYFKMKDDYFIPNSPEKVEQIKSAREAADLREREISEGANWLKEVNNNRHPKDPPLRDKIIQIITQLALYGKDAQDFRQGREMFARAGIKDIGQARSILVKLKVWDQDENLDLHRFKIRTEFGEPALEEAAIIASKEIDSSDREDLTDISVFTIDGERTKDFDDALSLQPTDGGWRLGVHITDLAPFIDIDGHLDKEAAIRASSIYLPAHQVPMLPSSLSHDTLSLIKGCNRLAISLLADFDREWNLGDYRFVPSIVRVQNQLTYDQVDASYDSDAVLTALHQLGQALRQRRIESGALVIPLPEIHFDLETNSGVQVRLVEQDTPARTIVAECMILYNFLAAKLASETKLPILYRGQEPPQERLFIDEYSYTYYVFQQRRKLQPLVIDTTAQPHSGLGVDVYTQATSPLRRYTDLVAQRQMRAALFEESPPYSETHLKELNLVMQQTLRDIEGMKRNQIRYWTLKHLTKRINERFSALVFQKLRSKYLVILTDFLLVGELPITSGLELSPGEEIGVVVKRSDPWDDLLVLEPAR